MNNTQKELNKQLFDLLNISFQVTLEKVEKLLEAGASSKAVDEYGFTPLHKAVQTKNTELGIKIIELLIDKYDANINAVTNTGAAPLHLALMDNPGIAKFLLFQRKVSTEVFSNGISHPLIFAIQCGNRESAEIMIQHTVLQNPDYPKPDDVTNNPELSEYWDSKVKKEIFLLNNQGIFNQMSEHFVISRDESDNPIYYAINRDKSLDSLISDAEKFLEETQEKLGIVINPAEFIEYRVEKRYFPSLKALTFGNVPFKCYEELSGGILDDPNVEQSKVGKAIG